MALAPEVTGTSCADVAGNVTDQMAANVSMITLWLVGICLIWLSKHIKENCVSTWLLRFSLVLITGIYLGL